MVTQKIVTRLSNDVLPPVRMVSGDVGREIQLEIYASDESTTPINLDNYSASITIIKPDNTFVIANFNADNVELPEQAGAVTGHGYYQIKIYTAGNHQIYTGQGPFIVDDDILSEETIESIAEANGYKFPDDFLTDADLREYVKKYELEDAIAGIIDDDETAANSTWSSAKINEELSNIGTTVTKTATGNPIEISDGADAPLVKCVTGIVGSQDLHGYSKPWIGGAGKNKFTIPNYSGSTYSGVTYSFDSHTNTLSKSGTSEGSGGTNVGEITLTNGTYTLSATFSETGSVTYIYLRNKATGVNTTYISSEYPSRTVELDGTYYIRLSTSTGATNGTISSIQLESGSTATAFEPYSNICPITAYTEGEIEVSDRDGNTTTHTTTYPYAIYRGSDDVVNGEVTTEWGIIASYAGETLPGEWISDRDVYAPGTTPTTGAQVAYKLATPTTAAVTVSDYPIKSLSGYTHIESSTGDMEVEHITQQWDPIMEATRLDKVHAYSTSEKVVGKWIDGRDVIECVYPCNVTWYNSNNYSPTFVTIPNISTIISATLMGHPSNIHMGSSSIIFGGFYYIDADGRSIKGYKEFAFGDDMVIDYIILRYVKGV